MSKVCSKCKEIKSLDKFSKDRSRSDGYCNRCKVCTSEYLKSKYNYKHPDYKYPKMKEKGQRNYDLKRFYGITLDDYNRIFIEQTGCCAMCGRHQSEFKKRLAVDHDHKTGKIRGLLCTNCNLKLGILEDKNLVELSKLYLAKCCLMTPTPQIAAAVEGENNG